MRRITPVLMAMAITCSAFAVRAKEPAAQPGKVLYDRASAYLRGTQTQDTKLVEEGSPIMYMILGMVSAWNEPRIRGAIMFAATKKDACSSEMLTAASVITRAECVPENVSADQLVLIVKNYLEANPAKWNEQAAGLVADALEAAFPCSAR